MCNSGDQLRNLCKLYVGSHFRGHYKTVCLTIKYDQMSLLIKREYTLIVLVGQLLLTLELTP